MKRVGMLLVLAAGCLVIGCRKSTTITTKDGTRATVTNSGKTTEVTIEGKNGAKMKFAGEGGLALPEGFPKDVPVYPGSTVTMGITTKEGIQVALKTADPANKVATFYNEKLKGNGWSIETTMNTGDGSMVTAKKDKRTVVAVMSRDSDATTISLTVQNEQ
jgi:hypothetical protein